MSSEILKYSILYGPGMFFAAVMLLFMFFVIKWVFKMFDTHVKQVADNLATLTSVVKSMQDAAGSHYNVEQKSLDYQRDEHLKISQAQTETLVEVRNLVKAIGDFECRARA